MVKNWLTKLSIRKEKCPPIMAKQIQMISPKAWAMNSMLTPLLAGFLN